MESCSSASLSLGRVGRLEEGRACPRSLPCLSSIVCLQSFTSQQKRPPCSSQSAGAQIIGLHSVSEESTDHEHGPRYSTTMGPDRVLGGCLGHRHQRGFKVAGQATQNSMACGESMVCGHRGHEHGLRQQRMGPGSSMAYNTSTWLRSAAQTTDICMVFGGSVGHGNQHRLWLQ